MIHSKRQSHWVALLGKDSPGTDCTIVDERPVDFSAAAVLPSSVIKEKQFNLRIRNLARRSELPLCPLWFFSAFSVLSRSAAQINGAAIRNPLKVLKTWTRPTL
jgi:hypothetical protein